MYQTKHLKREYSEVDLGVDVVTIKVEETEHTSHDNILQQSNNTLNTIFNKNSSMTLTETLRKPKCIKVNDCNIQIAKTEYNAQEIIIKNEENFQNIDELRDVFTGSSLNNKTKEQINHRNIKITCIKSENIVLKCDTENLYNCRVCEYKTANRRNIIKHSQIHSDKKLSYDNDSKTNLHTSIFVCNDCSYICAQRSRIVAHIRNHTNKKALASQMCHNTTMKNFNKHIIHTEKRHMSSYKHSDELMLFRNKIMNSSDQLYLRKHCDSRNIHKSPLIERKTQHTTGEKPYVCNHCDYTCTKKSYLSTHIKKHTGNKPYASNHGDLKSKVIGLTKERIGGKLFTCGQCDYSSTRKAHLNRHLKQHKGVKPYACDHCDYRSTQKSSLNRHIRQHTGEKPYACDHCDYRSARKCSIIKHSRQHTGEKPYTCAHCDYKSSCKANIITHIRRHTGEKPYMCDHCNYRSTCKSSIVRHNRKHTGVKPYMCDHCDYKGSRKELLIIHIKRHISVKKPNQKHLQQLKQTSGTIG